MQRRRASAKPARQRDGFVELQEPPAPTKKPEGIPVWVSLLIAGSVSVVLYGLAVFVIGVAIL